MSSDLQRLQRDMQRAIMAAAPPPAAVRGRDAEDRALRFGIYTSAYRLRLQEALAHNFPMLCAHLGDAAFGALANAHLDAHPSTQPSIRMFGEALAHWLERHEPAAPWLAELAHFEWTLGCAFDVPDDPALNLDALAHIEPNQWARLQFQFARSVHRVTCWTNAPALYESAAAGRGPAAGRREPQPTQWLIWRQALTPRYRAMTETESLAFDALASGATFGGMCAILLEHYDDEEVPREAAACLKRWLADELVVTLSLGEE